MSRKRNQQALVDNKETYEMWYQRLRDYALNMFEWSGLPKTVNERFMEKTMYEQGSTVWFIDDNLGMMALPVMYGGRVNHYNEPTMYQAVSIGYNRALNPDKAVLMWNNTSRQPTDYIVKQYAKRLTHVERTMDVNINAQKTPVLILAEESQRLTMENAYMMYEGGNPFIFGNKSGFDKEAFQVLKTDAPFVADKLMEYKHNLWNEAMTFFGVGNAKQDKKERLVSDEVSANDEQIDGARFIMLKARQEACEKINEMFGTNISVDFKFNKEQERQEAKLQKDGENNEQN